MNITDCSQDTTVLGKYVTVACLVTPVLKY